MFRPLLCMAAIATTVAAFLPGPATAEQDYVAKGMSVYAPRPVPAVFGKVAAVSPAYQGHGAATSSIDSTGVRQKAQQMLSDGRTRRLTIRNANTGADVSAEFWRDGSYDSWAMARFSQLLGDHRERDAASIDPRLIDLLWILAGLSGRDTVIVTSGYRSHHTNMRLVGGASDSLHVSGRALDIAIPGVAVQVVAGQAAALAWGGVGEYRGDGHVHVDVGSFRYWQQ